MLPFVREE
jgi:hypothetical protein